MLIGFHPRRDVTAPEGLPEGLVVSGFTLVHDIPRSAAGRVLIVETGGEEVAVDLFAYDVPADAEAATRTRDWGATFQLLHGSAADRARVRTLEADGRAGLFAPWLDRLPRVGSAAEWFMDFRGLSAVWMPDGTVAVSGAFAAPGEPGEGAEIAGCALVTPPGGSGVVEPLAGERPASLENGFALVGHAEAPPGATVELLLQIRRGLQSWWFRAEAAPVALPAFLETITLAEAFPGGLPTGDQAAHYAWVREALAGRAESLRGRLGGLGLAGAAARPGGTALLFDLDDEYAARLLLLLAPALEGRFARIVISGAAAAQAAAGLLRRGRMAVTVEADARAALALAAAGHGSVSPIATATLVDAAIEGNAGPLLAHALPADQVAVLAALHDAAGAGGIEGTLKRVVALMDGADPGGLPLAGMRPDAIGDLVAEHLRGLWELVPVTGAAR